MSVIESKTTPMVMILFLLFAITGCAQATLEKTNDELIAYAIRNGGEWVPQIKHLQGKDASIIDRKKLSKLSAEALKLITGISVAYAAMETVPDLHYLPSLKWLQLSHDKLRNISALSELTITYLDLENNIITDISAIAGLPLIGLDLGNNPLSKIGAINSCRQLESISLVGTRIEQLENLSALTNLKELWLNSTLLKNLSGIERIPSDFNLNIMGCTELTNIDALLSARVNTLFIDQETYDRFKQWFDDNVPKLKMKRPAFNIRFTMTE
jgi:hypothetical protein